MSQLALQTQPKRPLRSIGAILAGLLANIVIVGAIDAALRAASVYPAMFQPMTERQWALALSYRLLFLLAGGYLAARLAPARPMRHALILGLIQTLLSLLFVLANWSKPEFGPHWFALGVTVAGIPLAALGALPTSRHPAANH